MFITHNAPFTGDMVGKNAARRSTMEAHLWKALLQLPARGSGHCLQAASARNIAQMPIGTATIKNWS
ncbi:hypothetical protein ACWGY7_16760 [Xanthomonas axonopodis pv. khayae]